MWRKILFGDSGGKEYGQMRDVMGEFMRLCGGENID